MSAEHAHRPGPDDAHSNGARVDTVSVSGFEMYYESRGAGRPLVLLHGAMSTIETSFGAAIPGSRRAGGSSPLNNRRVAELLTSSVL
jgi:hypothetical protein